MPPQTLAQFIVKLYDVIFKPLILLLFGVAFIVFFWYVIECIQSAEEPAERKRCFTSSLEKIFGFMVMIGAVALVAVLANTVGVRNNVTLPEPVELPKVENPLAP